MDMHISNKGFSLIEMCIVLFVISVFMMLLPTNIHIPDTEYYAFVDEYLYLQSTAMKQAQPVSFDIYNVRFNQKGNVNQAKTIYFQNNRSIIVELGGGRLATQLEGIIYSRGICMFEYDFIIGVYDDWYCSGQIYTTYSI